MPLQLDGVYDLKQTLELYAVHQDKSCFSLCNSVWLRMTLPVHTALTAVRTLATQSIRCVSNLVGGIILLDGKRLLMAANDTLSLIVQAIVLPLLGVLAIVAPKAGYTLTKAICDKLDANDVRKGGNLVAAFPVPQDGRNVRHRIADAVMAIFGTLSAFIQVVTFGLERTIDFKFAGRPHTLWEAIRDKGETMAFACRGIFDNRHITTAYTAHRIAID